MINCLTLNSKTQRDAKSTGLADVLVCKLGSWLILYLLKKIKMWDLFFCFDLY